MFDGNFTTNIKSAIDQGIFRLIPIYIFHVLFLLPQVIQILTTMFTAPYPNHTTSTSDIPPILYPLTSCVSHNHFRPAVNRMHRLLICGAWNFLSPVHGTCNAYQDQPPFSCTINNKHPSTSPHRSHRAYLKPQTSALSPRTSVRFNKDTIPSTAFETPLHEGM
jgi:hypothetical protein